MNSLVASLADWNLVLAALVTAVVGPIVLLVVNRRLPVRRATTQERINVAQESVVTQMNALHAECREEVRKLRVDLGIERWRSALMIRALQTAGLSVPEAALLNVRYDPETDTYRVVRPVDD